MSLLANLQAFISAVGVDIKALTYAVNNLSLPTSSVADRPTNSGAMYKNSSMPNGGVVELAQGIGNGSIPLSPVSITGFITAAPTNLTATGVYVQTDGTPPSGVSLGDVFYWSNPATAYLLYKYANVNYLSVGQSSFSKSSVGYWTSTASSPPVPTALKIYKVPSTSLIPVFSSSSPVTSGGVTYTVSASTFYNSSFAPYMAFDGSFTSASWASNGQNINFWIQIQVSTPQVYDSFEIAGRSDGAEYPTGMIWQGSNDAIAWFDIIAATGLPSRFLAANDPTLANTKLFCSSNKAAYNYYRWSFPTGTGSNPGISGIKVFNLSTNPGTEIDNANLTTVAERIYFNAPYTLSSAQISYGLTCWNTLSSGVLNYAVFSGNGATKVSEAKLSNSNSTFDHKQVMSPMVIKNILQGNYPINPLALNANTRIESSNDYQLISASIGISR